jgi:hypothetical protein
MHQAQALQTCVATVRFVKIAKERLDIAVASMYQIGNTRRVIQLPHLSDR